MFYDPMEESERIEAMVNDMEKLERELAQMLMDEMGKRGRRKASRKRATAQLEDYFREVLTIEGATWTEDEYIREVGNPFAGFGEENER